MKKQKVKNVIKNIILIMIFNICKRLERKNQLLRPYQLVKQPQVLEETEFCEIMRMINSI